MTILLVIVHLILLFAAVVICKVAESKDIVDDADMALCVSLFVPLGVIVFIAALWVGKIVSDSLT